ncbi:MAG: alpha-L-fucosidase [Prolixibacteraceae bacterium]|nr:alpha-L-fucosidase [Prolixibacteraceae bacterium]MBN2774454.1 alpha-L-fucosidase [Prolixibacteraceae bacterium]
MKKPVFKTLGKLRSGLTLLPVLFFVLSQMTNCRSSVQAESALKKKQEEFSSWKYGMFLHFNMATYIDREWATGYEDPMLFNPVNLDCGQWTEVIKSAGMKYAVFTAKHTGGWCLWDSKYTTHDITAFRNYKNGKGDIVKEFVDACREKGIKVGLYYCLPGDYSYSYGNSLEPGQKDFHGLPPEAEGDFEGFIEKQVTELLTGYGKIDLMWFDQYSNKYTGNNWLQLKTLVHKLQPECIVIANNADNYTDSDIIGYEYPWRIQANPETAIPPQENTNVSELCDCIDANGIWFWHTGEIKLLEAEDVAARLKQFNERKTNLLLDVPPDRNGLIDSVYIKHLATIKQLALNF